MRGVLAKNTNMKNKKIKTVIKHWKPVFIQNKWILVVIVLGYTMATYFDLLLKPVKWKEAFDALVAGENPWPAFSFIVLALVLSWIANRISDRAITFAESRVIRNLKDYSIKMLLQKGTDFFQNNASGAIVAKVKRFAGTSENIIDEFAFTIIRTMFFVVYLCIYSFIVLPKLAPVFLGWVLIFVTVNVIFSQKRMKLDGVLAQRDSNTTAHVADIIISVFTLRYFSATKKETDRFAKTIDDEMYARINTWKHGNVQRAIQSFLVISLELGVMAIVIKDVRSGIETIGTLALVQSYIATLSSNMWAFGRSVIKVRSSIADAYEMSELLENPNTEKVDDPDGDLKLSSTDIKFQNVSFKYNEGVNAINLLSFVFEHGNRYGLVGLTGSGKTTITKLIMRLYDVDSGKILLGSKDIRKIDKNTLRSFVSYVPQDPVFPNRTIREIISIGKPKSTEEEVISVAKRAKCDFIFDKLPKGLDTVIGERGVKLSGGERQRLAIAAAILENSSIIIMDEPTSSLDADTEEFIQHTIKDEFIGKTMIIVAHRLSTVAVLDEVVLLKDGNIKAHAPHETLKKISNEYRNMWNKQTNPII